MHKRMDWKSVKFDWNRARAFLVTAEEGSLSAAARALDMAQPTLGRQVTALEQELGVVLFDRVGTGLVLTPGGLELLEQGEKLLESIEEEHLQRKDTRAALTMAISKRITRALGGELKVDYAPADKQLHVHLRLPATIVSAMRRFSGGKPEVPIKILLVEDHFLNQIATKQILTTWSPLVTVDIAENGLVGYEKFRAHGYDLVLMDIQMPEMNGIEAARKIREISDVPIIALTAHASRQEQDKCFEAGMNDYLTKPFQPEELYARIMHHMSMVKN